MSEDEVLEQLATRAGVSTRWVDFRGEARTVAPGTLRRILGAMGLPCESRADVRDALRAIDDEQARAPLPPMLTAVAGEALDLPATSLGSGSTVRIVTDHGENLDRPLRRRGDRVQLEGLDTPGYHRLQLDDREIELAVAPQRAFSVEDVAPGERLWGVAAQIYSLRHEHEKGFGGFTALADLARCAGHAGADAVLASPVHALFTAEPNRFGPYAPSTRVFRNALHADPADILGAGGLMESIGALGLGEELQRLEGLSLIDWPAAITAKVRLLRAAFDRIEAGPLGPDREDRLAEEFADFRHEFGQALEDHARFEALHAVQRAEGRWSWRTWPEALRDPRSAAVEAFAEKHQEDVRFHVFLQWLADRGVAGAQREALAAGMRIGMIADLAVGTDGDGSHAWRRPQDLLVGLSVGAPPDPLNHFGQRWGLTTFSPRALRAQCYGPFLETLRTAMRNAGGVRIDHVLGLNRLWLVPEDAPPVEGAYLRYPLTDLLRLVALESWRHRNVVIGEDLGTVPDGFRDELERVGVLGMRVLYFHREHGYFVEPKRWPRAALATTSTHDLPPVAGWWAGRDLDWRTRLGQFPDPGSEAQERTEREQDRRALWGAFTHEGLVEGPVPAADGDATPVVDAAIRFVTRTPSPLAVLPIEDLAGLDEQPNLPGTTDGHPNWRRRLPAAAEVLLQEPGCATRLAHLREERGRNP